MPSLREDRFFYPIPIVSQKKFYDSNFLKFYDKTVRHPDKNTVIQSLRELHHHGKGFWSVIQAIENAPDEHDVIRTYSSNITVGSHTFYTYINQQLCKDDEQTVQKLMPLIRRATKQINFNPPTTACIVYRGIELNEEQLAYMEINTIFRFPGFTSTSKSKELAQTFGNTVFEIHIYAGCPQVKDISNISHYPSEQEYLFSPYSLFKVTGKNGKLIVLTAIDNLSKLGMDSAKEFPSSATINDILHDDSANICENLQECCSSNCIIL